MSSVLASLVLNDDFKDKQVLCSEINLEYIYVPFSLKKLSKETIFLSNLLIPI